MFSIIDISKMFRYIFHVISCILCSSSSFLCLIYFQKLEERITTMTDPEEKVKCQLILEHANVSRYLVISECLHNFIVHIRNDIPFIIC